MTLYQRISPVYEAVKYEPGMESGLMDSYWESPDVKAWKKAGKSAFITLSHLPGRYKIPYLMGGSRGNKTFKLRPDSVILTNTATGERSVVSQKEFEREFQEVLSND